MKILVHLLFLVLISTGCTAHLRKLIPSTPRAQASRSTYPGQCSGPGKTVSFEELQALFAGKQIRATCCEQNYCGNTPHSPHRSCERDPGRPLEPIPFEPMLMDCISRDNYLRKAQTEYTPPLGGGYIDTIVFDSGEKLHFNTKEAESKILALNPQVRTTFWDQEKKIFLNCQHAQNPLPLSSYNLFERARKMFLEINNCVPRGRYYEFFLIEEELERLDRSGTEEQKFLKAMEGCDKGDAQLCFVAGHNIPLVGEKSLERKLDILGRACKMKYRNACDTQGVWQEYYNGYKSKTPLLSKKCENNDIPACKELEKTYRLMKMNLPAARKVADKLCEASLKQYCGDRP